VIFHLGSRVGALVDGQLPSAQAERAWAHVHACAVCRAAVEREGWIKRELAGLSFSAPAAPPLRLAPAGDPWATAPDAAPADPRQRRLAGLAALGAGSVGAAMFGVLVLGAAPAEAPQQDRRSPVTDLQQPVSQAPARTRSNNDNDDAAETLMAVLVRMGL